MSNDETITPDERGSPQHPTRWKPGQSGNPSGRPAGSRNRASLLVDTLLEGEGQALARRAVQLAMGGDTTALRLCMERLCPPRKDRPVQFALPALESVGDAVGASAAILEAVAAGDLTPSEAADLHRLVDGFVKAIEVHDFGVRLERLEAAAK